MPTESECMSRRQLLQAVPIAVAPLFVPASALGRGGTPAPSDRISLGVIGVNQMGRENLRNCARHADVAVTAICDVSQTRREAALEPHKNTAKGYSDYRELLARCGYRCRHHCLTAALACADGDRRR